MDPLCGIESIIVTSESTIESAVAEWAAAVGAPQPWSIWQQGFAAIKKKLERGGVAVESPPTCEYNAWVGSMRTEIYTELFGPEFAKLIPKMSLRMKAQSTEMSLVPVRENPAQSVGPAPGPTAVGVREARADLGGRDFARSGGPVPGPSSAVEPLPLRAGAFSQRMRNWRDERTGVRSLSPEERFGRRRSPGPTGSLISEAKTAPIGNVRQPRRALAFSLSDPGSDKAVSAYAGEKHLSPGDSGYVVITEAAADWADQRQAVESETSEQCMGRLEEMTDELRANGHRLDEVQAVVDLEFHSRELVALWKKFCSTRRDPPSMAEWAADTLLILNETGGAAETRRELEIQVRALGRWAGLTYKEQNHKIDSICMRFPKRREQAREVPRVEELFQTPGSLPPVRGAGDLWWGGSGDPWAQGGPHQTTEAKKERQASEIGARDRAPAERGPAADGAGSVAIPVPGRILMREAASPELPGQRLEHDGYTTPRGRTGRSPKSEKSTPERAGDESLAKSLLEAVMDGQAKMVAMMADRGEGGAPLTGLDVKQNLPVIKDADPDIDKHVKEFQSVLDCQAVGRRKVRPYDKLSLFRRTLAPGSVRLKIYDTLVSVARDEERLPEDAEAVYGEVLAKLRASIRETPMQRQERVEAEFEALRMGRTSHPAFRAEWERCTGTKVSGWVDVCLPGMYPFGLPIVACSISWPLSQ